MLLAWILTPLAIVAAIYGFHRGMLYLEKCDWRSSWREGSSGGYCPLVEIYQPQIRHVVQVEEQQRGDSEDGAGDEPTPNATGCCTEGHSPP